MDNNSLYKNHWPWWRMVLTALILLALFLSTVLSWHYFKQGSIPGCSGGSPCDQVLSSRWSTLAGILPVSGLAMGAYLSLLIASFYINQDIELSVRRVAWRVLLVLAGAVGGSALWFIIVQKWIIGDFCFYCMTTHTTGLLLTGIIIWQALMEWKNPAPEKLPENSNSSQKILPVPEHNIIRPFQVLVYTLAGISLAGILAISQFKFIPAAVIQTNNSKIKLVDTDYQNSPLIGSSEADYYVTLLFDYQCSHCQKLHFMLNEAIEQYDGKLAFLLCPTPLHHDCNPYIPENTDVFKNSCELAKTGLAVWLARREAFSDFENWMFTFESGNSWHPRGLEAARTKAIELVGYEKFNDAISDPWIEEYLQSGIRIFGQTIQNGKAGIPKLIYGQRWVIPEPYNTGDLISILQESLQVPKP